MDSGRRQTGLTWSQFLRSQAEAILACDFFTVDLLDGTQAYALAVIEHTSRRIRILGSTLHPTGEWTAQQARNLVMDLDEQAHRVKFMIRDRGSNFTAAFDAVLADADIRTVLCNIQTPRMNAITERWIGGCRRELLDRTLVWNQTHLRQILHVPRAAQHHHKRPDGAQLAGDRVQPPAQLPVVDLRLLPGLRRERGQYPHLRSAGLFRHVRRHIPAHARHADRQAMLITQPLMDG